MRLQLFACLRTHLAHFYTYVLFFFCNVKSAQQFLSLLIKFALFCTIFFSQNSLEPCHILTYDLDSVLTLSKYRVVLAGASLGFICSVVCDYSVLEPGKVAAERLCGISNICLVDRTARRYKQEYHSVRALKASRPLPPEYHPL